MITQIVYARLYNTGNYENLRLEATAIVEDGDTQAAFAEARMAVEIQYQVFVTAREEAERRQREAWDAQEKERRAKYEAAALRERQEQDARNAEDPPF